MLPDGRAPWRYKHDVEEWRAYLADPPPFMEIVDLLCAGLVAEGWWIQRADRSPLLVAHGCKRVALKLVPSDASDPAARKVLDLFFNSTAGYRAQFYISADQGDRATAELFAALLLGPLAEGARGGIGEFSGADVARSLRSLAAKVWINDEAVPLEGRRDIQAPRWIEAQDGKPSRPVPTGKTWTVYMGTSAPIPDYLAVYGAWLDRQRCIFMDPEKADRSARLSAFGWV